MRRAVLVASALALASCGPSEATDPPDAAAGDEPRGVATLSPPLELSELMERGRLAFYEVDGRYEGGDLHYRARVDASGLSLIGFHRPPGASLRISEALSFAPARALRGDAVLAARAAGPERQPDGTLSIDRGWAREELVNGPSGVEQRWRFDRAPAGRGALVVRLDAPSLALLAADEAGLHLAPAPGELGLVYGHGTWIDADGARTHVEARWREGGVELEIDAGTLARTRFPAVLDPVLGPEVGPGVSAYVAAPGTQWLADLASGSGGSLAVWIDSRRGPDDVFAARLSGTSVLDVAGILVNEPGGDAGSTAVAYGGGVYLIAWSQSGRILARRLAPSGAFSDATPIVVREAANAGGVDAVFDGTDFVIGWNEGVSGDPDVKAARVSVDGSVLDSAPLVLYAGAGAQSGVALAASGGTVYAAWTDTRTDSGDVYGARIAAGAVLDAGGVVLASGTGYQGVPALTAGAGTILLGWTDTGVGVLRIVPLDASGTPSGTPRAVASGAVYSLTLASHPTGHMVAWEEVTSTERVVYASPLAASGASAGGAVVVARARSTGPNAMVYDGSGYVLTTHRSDSSTLTNADLYVHRLWTSGSVSSSQILAQAGLPQTGGEVAESAGSYLMVWTTQRGGLDGLDVLGLRIDASGSAIDVTPLAIATGTDDQSDPDVAGDGSGSWLAAWTNRRPASGSAYFTDVRARTVSAAGTMSSPIDVERGGVVTVPSVAGDPSGYVVIYADYPDMVVRRVTRFGSLSGSAVILGPQPYSGAETAAACGDGGCQIAWVHHPSGGRQIWGARVSSTGTVTPSGGRMLVSDTEGNSFAPALAAGGGAVLLAWMRQTWSFRQSVRAMRLDVTGAPMGSAFEITTSAADARYPAAAYVGSDFFVSYDRARSTTQADGARVTTGGVVRDLDGVPLQPDAYGTDLASGGGGRAMLLYHGFHASPTTNTRVVRGRIIDFTVPGTDPNGSACSTSWTCASGFCVDGVCCASACGGGARDCQVCSTALGASADGACTVVPAGLECRATRGPCDVAESCDGTAGECPADGFVAAGTSCGAAATEPCDVDDVCTGASPSCATSARAPAGTECRAPAGACDVAETCDGSSVACPADVVRSAGAICRPAEGECDVADACDGVSIDCGSDRLVLAGATCRESAGVCDPRERCDGRSKACPTNVLSPAGAVCRDAAGPCDAEETCTGTSASCPFDALVPAGTVCRPAAGDCDLDERCDGREVGCAPDVLSPRGTICRDASGPCDVAEACDGTHPRCSIDRDRADGSSCDDGLQCNGASVCSAGECVEGEPIACDPGATCVEVLGECQLPPAGCGCRASSGRAPPPALAMALAIVLAAIARRRRA